MKIWKWLLLTFTALASYAFALLNPFSQPIPGVEVHTPTAFIASATPTLEVLAPTATGVAATLAPTPTLTRTPAPTATPTPIAHYGLQPGSPAYLQMFRQPELACSWTGVAGQIFDRDGQPVTGIVVVVEGKLDSTRWMW
jgi:hypothetical protein